VALCLAPRTTRQPRGEQNLPHQAENCAQLLDKDFVKHGMLWALGVHLTGWAMSAGASANVNSEWHQRAASMNASKNDLDAKSPDTTDPMILRTTSTLKEPAIISLKGHGNAREFSLKRPHLSAFEESDLKATQAKLNSPYGSQAQIDRLWQYIFQDYNPSVAPVPVSGGVLKVGIGVKFANFRAFDSVEGTISLTIDLLMSWADPRLEFNAAKFFNRSWNDGGDKLPIDPNLLWTPDITILNQVKGAPVVSSAHSPLVLADRTYLNKTGVNVLWSRLLDVQTACFVDMTLYPFDVQRCSLRVGPWASTRRTLEVVPLPHHSASTLHSNEFQVRNITTKSLDIFNYAVGARFSEVVYTLNVERFPHHHVINFILPMIAVTLLTISTMWLSLVNTATRVNAGTKLLLCVVSIIFITARHRPAIHGDIWLDKFQSHCLAIAMAAVLQSLIIDHISKSMALPVWSPSPYVLDSFLRSVISVVAGAVIVYDLSVVEALNFQQLVGLSSTRLLLSLIGVLCSPRVFLQVFLLTNSLT